MNILVKKEKRAATLSALRPFYVCIYNKVLNPIYIIRCLIMLLQLLP